MLPNLLLHQEVRACHQCGLRDLCHGPVGAEGPSQCRLAFVGESPGEGEDRSGRPFQGAAGKFLDQLFEWYLEPVGIFRAQCLITNLVKCRPPDNDFDIARDHKAHLVCPPLWLDKEIQQANPQIVVALGAQAARYLMRDWQFSMDKDHGIPRLINGHIVFPIYHPAAGFHDSRNLRHTMDDFKQLARLISTIDLGVCDLQQCIDRIIPHDLYAGKELYQVATTTDQALSLLSQPFFAIDTETIPTAEGQKLWSIQVSSAPGTAWFIPAHLVPDPRTAIPPTSTVLVHNWLYDEQFIHIPSFLDTMMMAYLLQLQLGLKDLAWRLCGMEMHDYDEYTKPYRRDKALGYLRKIARVDWGAPPKIDPEWKWDNKKRDLTLSATRPRKINQKIYDRIEKSLDDPSYDPYVKWRDVDSREKVAIERRFGPMLDASLEDAPFDDALFYSCRDPDATFRIAPILSAQIQELGLEKVLMDLDLPTLEFAREMMDEGMMVDEQVLRDLSEQCIEGMKSTVDQMEQKLKEAKDQQSLSYDQVLPFITPNGLNFRFNPNSPIQTAKYVLGWDGKGKLPSTEEKVIKQLDHPAAPFIVEYRQNAKIKDSYADKLLPFLDDRGRVHCDVFPAGTETGRLRMSNPPLQAIPTRTKLGGLVRNAFKARSGYVILCIDYSQIEMRVLAHVSRCKNLIYIFTTGGDAHTVMATRVFHVTEDEVWADEKRYRYPVKRLHFGVVYGITAVGLYNGMIEEGAEGWELDQCQAVIDTYYEENPEIRGYTQQQLNQARMFGYVRDPLFGRIRHIPEVYVPINWIAAEGERQAANMPIAAAAQGILKTATRQIRDWRREVWNKQHPDRPFYMINQIHDELIFEVPIEHLHSIAYCCKSIMEDVGEQLNLCVPIVAECKAGESWGTATKLEFEKPKKPKELVT